MKREYSTIKTSEVRSVTVGQPWDQKEYHAQMYSTDQAAFNIPTEAEKKMVRKVLRLMNSIHPYRVTMNEYGNFMFTHEDVAYCVFANSAEARRISKEAVK